MSLELFRSIVEQIDGANETVTLSFMGEPLLHPHLEDMISFAKSRGLRIGVFTNALLLDRNRSKKLLDTGLDRLYLSHDVREEDYGAVRTGGDFRATRQNVLDFLEQKRVGKLHYPRTILYSTGAMPDRETVKFWRARVDEFHHNPTHDWTGTSELIRSRKSLRSSFRNPICKMPWHGMVILVDGRVVPCCYDSNAEYIIGDLKEAFLPDLWNNERMQSLRRMHLERRQSELQLCRCCTSGPDQGDTPGLGSLLRQIPRLLNAGRVIR